MHPFGNLLGENSVFIIDLLGLWFGLWLRFRLRFRFWRILVPRSNVVRINHLTCSRINVLSSQRVDEKPCFWVKVCFKCTFTSRVTIILWRWPFLKLC